MYEFLTENYTTILIVAIAVVIALLVLCIIAKLFKIAIGLAILCIFPTSLQAADRRCVRILQEKRFRGPICRLRCGIKCGNGYFPKKALIKFHTLLRPVSKTSLQAICRQPVHRGLAVFLSTDIFTQNRIEGTAMFTFWQGR